MCCFGKEEESKSKVPKEFFGGFFFFSFVGGGSGSCDLGMTEVPRLETLRKLSRSVESYSRGGLTPILLSEQNPKTTTRYANLIFTSSALGSHLILLRRHSDDF